MTKDNANKQNFLMEINFQEESCSVMAKIVVPKVLNLQLTESVKKEAEKIYLVLAGSLISNSSLSES